jgi:hypothetical protein
MPLWEIPYGTLPTCPSAGPSIDALRDGEAQVHRRPDGGMESSVAFCGEDASVRASGRPSPSPPVSPSQEKIAENLIQNGRRETGKRLECRIPSRYEDQREKEGKTKETKKKTSKISDTSRSLQASSCMHGYGSYMQYAGYLLRAALLAVLLGYSTTLVAVMHDGWLEGLPGIPLYRGYPWPHHSLAPTDGAMHCCRNNGPLGAAMGNQKRRLLRVSNIAPGSVRVRASSSRRGKVRLCHQ